MPLLSTYITWIIIATGRWHYLYMRCEKFMLREIANARISKKIGRELICDDWQTGINPKPSTRTRPKTSRQSEWHWRETCTSWCELFAQSSRSSVIIITSWRLHVQVFAVGESTGDESTHCSVIQIMPSWNSRKSQDTTNCRSKTNVHRDKAFKEITAWLLLIIEFNEVNMMAL